MPETIEGLDTSGKGARDIDKKKVIPKKTDPGENWEQKVEVEPDFTLVHNAKGKLLRGWKEKRDENLVEYSEFTTFYSDMSWEPVKARALDIIERAISDARMGMDEEGVYAQLPNFDPNTAKMTLTVKFES